MNEQTNFFDNELTKNLQKLPMQMQRIFELMNQIYANALQQNWENCLAFTPELSNLINSYTIQQTQNFNDYEKSLFINIQKLFVDLNERLQTHHQAVKKLLDGFDHAAARKN